jgi:uncharacterized surface protein with fasciclin (FAS1) repeats
MAIGRGISHPRSVLLPHSFLTILNFVRSLRFLCTGFPSIALNRVFNVLLPLRLKPLAIMAFVSSVGAAVVAGSTAASCSAVCHRQTTMRGTPLRSCSNRAPVLTVRAAITRMATGDSVVECLKSYGNYKTLLSLSEACGVDLDAVKGTLFAPSDAAFEYLKPGTIEAWYAKLDVAKAILLHHVLPGKVLTLAKITGVGYWEGTMGGSLAYEGLGGVIKVGGAKILQESSNRECEGAIIHTIDSLLTPLGVKPASAFAGYMPSIPSIGDTVINSLYPSRPSYGATMRAFGAASMPATSGGRKAMNLISPLPFWQYGPPYNAVKQIDYEPVSLAGEAFANSCVDYQLMPAGSVVVVPDSVNANELNPISGMSKYIGNTKRQIEGDAQSDYSTILSRDS